MKHFNNIQTLNRFNFNHLGHLFSLFLLLFITGCEKEDYIEHSEPILAKEIVENEYNQDLENFTLAVQKSLVQSKEFRTMIQSEALKQNRGDFDVLLKDILHNEVRTIGSNNKSSFLSVEELLSDNFVSTLNSEKSGSKTSAASVIKELSEKYPHLQISVPVNAEQWDSSSNTPVITFLPRNYSDATTATLIGYDQSGQEVMLDAVKEPDYPVIVIGQNERSMMMVEPIGGGETEAPTPINLTGSETEAGLRLSWSLPAGSNIYFSGYYVYRKSTINNSYEKVATISGAFNRSYDDNQVAPGASYSYYVVSFDGMQTSLPSNYITITAPLRPKPVLSFDAIQNALNEIELRWENDNSQFIESTTIQKHVIGVTSDYQSLGTFSADQHHYMDHDLIKGKQVNYQINHVTSLGVSNAKYDFVRVPYRDISEPSPVYIKQIKYSDDRIERWPAGKPEFIINVANVDVNKSAYPVQDGMKFVYDDNDSRTSQEFSGRKVLDWDPGYWYDMLTFTVVEYDVSFGTMDITASVGYNKKNALKTGLDVAGKVEYNYEVKDEGERCGSQTFSYYAVPDQWIQMPNYGVEIRVSDDY